MIVWGVHYIPFFLMGRQLFIHHYLPSHVASSLIAGAVLSFILSESVNFPVSVWGPTTRGRPKQYADLGIKAPIIYVVFAIVMFAVLVFFAPLTYGTPG